MTKDLYQQILLEHYKHPHHKGKLENADFSTLGHNPNCGDKITVYGKIDDQGKISELQFDGKGCAICIASASMLTSAMREKEATVARDFAQKFRRMMRDEEAFEVPENAPDLEALQGVKQFALRIKCATLAWNALETGINEYLQETPV